MKYMCCFCNREFENLNHKIGSGKEPICPDCYSEFVVGDDDLGEDININDNDIFNESEDDEYEEDEERVKRVVIKPRYDSLYNILFNNRFCYLERTSRCQK
jgi:hypothetical protein